MDLHIALKDHIPPQTMFVDFVNRFSRKPLLNTIFLWYIKFGDGTRTLSVEIAKDSVVVYGLLIGC